MPKPLSRLACLLAVALAGCGGDAPEATGAHASDAPAQVAASGDAYAACRERARGEAPALVVCFDRAIADSGRGIDSAPAAAAFRAALREMGDRFARDGGQARQVEFAARAVDIARQRAALLSGAPAGATRAAAAPGSRKGGGPAWDRSRMLSCQEHQVPDCAARYDGLLAMLGADDDRGGIPITKPVPPSGLPLPTCAEVRTQGRTGGALADAFDARYPASLVGTESVETVTLDPAAIDNVVRYLVCVADATNYEPVVAENGLALFASRRHGKAALARLAALSQSGDPSAKQFEEQIKGYLAGPGE